MKFKGNKRCLNFSDFRCSKDSEHKQFAGIGSAITMQRMSRILRKNPQKHIHGKKIIISTKFCISELRLEFELKILQ